MGTGDGTDRVRLRPPTDADGEVLRRLRSEAEASPFNWFGAPFSGDDAASEGRRIVAEFTDEQGHAVPVGDLTWHEVRYGPNPESAACNLGITLLAEYRGRGIGSEAQRLLAEHLFATTTTNRVEASTEVTNVAEQRSLERAGFTREGTARGAQFRDGEYRDMVTYSRLRSDS
ncbi:MAG: GNAT family protein [Chloroflexi bacterium]|nr:GNAT family protein [Chloroflexota bacterium]MDA1145409.1 GNAT family protein [Chloroflexota bacterium]